MQKIAKSFIEDEISPHKVASCHVTAVRFRVRIPCCHSNSLFDDRKFPDPVEKIPCSFFPAEKGIERIFPSTLGNLLVSLFADDIKIRMSQFSSTPKLVRLASDSETSEM
jgi:hypothetical protein